MWIIISMVTITLILTIYGVIPTIVYRILNRQKRMKTENIYLTFDDGVDSKYTKEVLIVLKKYKILATFFVVAEFARNNPEIIKEIKKDGHVIALHSLEHKNEIFQTPKNTKIDFLKSIEILKELNVNPKFFRPPWGHFNLVALREIRNANLKIVLWDVIVGDWKANIKSTTIANRLLTKTKKGDIICLHDGRGKNYAPKRTIEALEIVIPIWKAKGFNFGTVEELYEQR